MPQHDDRHGRPFVPNVWHVHRGRVGIVFALLAVIGLVLANPQWIESIKKMRQPSEATRAGITPTRVSTQPDRDYIEIRLGSGEVFKRETVQTSGRVPTKWIHVPTGRLGRIHTEQDFPYDVILFSGERFSAYPGKELDLRGKPHDWFRLQGKSGGDMTFEITIVR